MDTRAQYFIQVLEKIGSPLMAAIIDFDKGLKDDGAQAKTIAELLAKSVESGIALGDLIDIGVMGEKSDSMRVALAAVSANLVADFHRITGKAPGEKEIKAIAAAMQAVLTFSENFTPSQENVARLNKLVADGSHVDVPQIQAQYMQAFAPVITAIAEFPFGHQEIKLMNSVSSRLIAKAETMAKILDDSADELVQKSIALSVLKALIPLYDSCHRSETARVMAMSEDERAAQPKDSGGGLSLESLWERFETRATLLETLVNNIVGGGQETAAASDTQAPAAPAAETPTTPEAPAQESPPPAEDGNPMSMFAKKPSNGAAPPETPPASSPPSAPPAQPSSPPAEDGNPMSMFANKKPSGDTSPASPPPATPPPSEPSAPPPVEKPVDQTPPSEQKDGGDSEDSGNSGGGPMSFFKNPPKD